MRIGTKSGRKRGENGIRVIINDEKGRNETITVHDISFDDLYGSILFFLKTREKFGNKIYIREEVKVCEKTKVK